MDERSIVQQPDRLQTSAQRTCRDTQVQISSRSRLMGGANSDRDPKNAHSVLTRPLPASGRSNPKVAS